MTCRAATAGRPGSPPRRVRPDVGRLHTSITVLAIGDGTPDASGCCDRAFERGDVAEHPAWILDEPPCRVRLPGEREGFGDVGDGIVDRWLRGAVLVPVPADSEHREALARGRRPKHIGGRWQVSWPEEAYVGKPVGAVAEVAINGVRGMAERSRHLAERFRTAEELDCSHDAPPIAKSSSRAPASSFSCSHFFGLPMPLQVSPGFSGLT